MPRNVKAIETVEEFEDAKKRIVKLDTSMPGSAALLAQNR